MQNQRCNLLDNWLERTAALVREMKGKQNFHWQKWTDDETQVNMAKCKQWRRANRKVAGNSICYTTSPSLLYLLNWIWFFTFTSSRYSGFVCVLLFLFRVPVFHCLRIYFSRKSLKLSILVSASGIISTYKYSHCSQFFRFCRLLLLLVLLPHVTLLFGCNTSGKNGKRIEF